MRGGLFFPDAMSITAEQWASIWPTSILPHRRCAANYKMLIRAMTSSTVSLSYRFFIKTPKHACIVEIIASATRGPEYNHPALHISAGDATTP